MHHLNYRPIFAKWTSTALLECHVPPQLSVRSIFFGLPDGVDFQMGLFARWGYVPAFPTAKIEVWQQDIFRIRLHHFTRVPLCSAARRRRRSRSR